MLEFLQHSRIDRVQDTLLDIGDQTQYWPDSKEHEDMKHYSGACHCGAVCFSFTANKIDTGMRCDCSICEKKGIIMSDEVIPPDRFAIDARPGVLKVYRFGSETASHYFCGLCGVHTFVQTRLNPGHYRANLGCVEGVETSQLAIELYDGKSL